MTEVITAPRLPAPERRKQLLDTALRVFARQGYHETSMNAVANEAGVTKPVLYQHFASKREMYSDLLRVTADRLADAIAQTRVDLGAEDTRCKVEAGYLGFFRFFDDVPDAFSVLYGPSLGHDQELRHVAQRVQEEFELSVYKEYLPEDMSQADVQKMIEDILSEKSISQMSQIGQVMGELKKRSNNRADMGFASKFVKEKLS